MVAMQVVDVGTDERVALRVVQQEESEFARFVTRVEHRRCSVARDVNTARTIDYFKINRHARSYFKLIRHPETPVNSIRATCNDGRIKFGFKIRAFDRDKILSLPPRRYAQRDHDLCRTRKSVAHFS